MGSCKGICVSALANFFEYDTVKIVHVKNKKVGVIKRLIQFAVLAYIIGYVIVYKKGYQETDMIVSSTTSKVKGIGWTNYTALNMTGPGGVTYQIWDVADYVIPPQELGGLFVMTNVIVTPNQTQDVCPESLSVAGALCSNDSDCTRGSQLSNGNGVMTGRCVNSSDSKKTCEVHSWCPIEIDVTPAVALLEGTNNFTILLKNNIVFNKFNSRRRNILDSQNSTYLKSCHFVPGDAVNHLCPVFDLGTMVSQAGIKSYNDIAIQGGVIAVNINWNCNLDYSIDYCLPDYSFQRLDEVNATIAPGNNFRYASFYEKEGRQYRDLIKAYGIVFDFKVTGVAGRFSVVPLLQNVGSGVGVLTIAVVVGDVVLCYLVKKRRFYSAQKYHEVKEDDDDTDDDDRLLTVEEHDTNAVDPVANRHE